MTQTREEIEKFVANIDTDFSEDDLVEGDYLQAAQIGFLKAVKIIRQLLKETETKIVVAEDIGEITDLKPGSVVSLQTKVIGCQEAVKEGELLNCPFCGSNDIDPEGVSSFKKEYRKSDLTWDKDASPDKIEHRPACNNCGADGGEGDWNTRASRPGPANVPSPQPPKGELLPCPFCAGEAWEHTFGYDRIGQEPDYQDPNFNGTAIECKKCLCSTRVFFGEKTGLREAWQARASIPQPEWQNISTAPKTGDPFIAKVKRGRKTYLHILKWHDEDGDKDLSDFVNDEGDFVDGRIIEWRPL